MYVIVLGTARDRDNCSICTDDPGFQMVVVLSPFQLSKQIILNASRLVNFFDCDASNTRRWSVHSHMIVRIHVSSEHVATTTTKECAVISRFS